MQEPLLTEIDQNVGIITLNRPERRNAFDASLVKSLHQALEAMANTPDVRILVLSSSGKFFCGGADLHAMQEQRLSTAEQQAEQNLEEARALAAMLHCLAHFNKPTIARIQGAAYGGGLGLVAACDIAIASFDAQFALSEVKLGLIPAVISPYLIAALGARAARRYMLTAETFSAAEAYRLGLVHEIVTDEAALDDAIGEIVTLLLHNAPQALNECKSLIQNISSHPLNAESLEYTAQCNARLRASAEAQEGIAAFLEKRRPHWQTST